MGRHSTRLKIDSDRLRAAIGSRETFSEIAQKYGVSKQAVSGWLSEGLIPPRALIEICRELDLKPDVLEEILRPQTEKNREKKKWTVTLTVEED